MERHCNHLPTADRGSCSTIIVGKNVSATGRLLIAHNEDDYDCVIQVHRVPRMQHKEGDTISFPDAKAVIPQVPETNAYLWSEYRTPGGISFADCFVNEWGVSVMTNSCKPCKVTDAEPQDVGLGYGLRRLIAERCKTAREGVEVAIGLIETYGYISSRTYQICDKDEAWVIHVPTGKRYVARRVSDDEVYFIPNHYVIHEVDLSDTAHKNYYVSKDLVEYPIRHGWYTPKTAGDYSDFDFAAAYQDGVDKVHNVIRSRCAWKFITGSVPASDRIFSMKPNRKLGVADLKKLFRTHYEDGPVDYSEGYKRNPHLDRDPAALCNTMTAESFVVVFDENPALTCIWRSTIKPCISPYTPWYLGITAVPAGYSWLDPVVSQPTHFNPAPSELAYDPTRAHWSFRVLQYLTEFDYKNTHETIQASVREMEKRWDGEQETVRATYKSLLAASPVLAEEYLTSYTATQAKATWDWANGMIQQLGEAKIMENSTCGVLPKEVAKL